MAKKLMLSIKDTAAAIMDTIVPLRVARDQCSISEVFEDAILRGLGGTIQGQKWVRDLLAGYPAARGVYELVTDISTHPVWQTPVNRVLAQVIARTTASQKIAAADIAPRLAELAEAIDAAANAAAAERDAYTLYLHQAEGDSDTYAVRLRSLAAAMQAVPHIPADAAATLDALAKGDVARIPMLAITDAILAQGDWIFGLTATYDTLAVLARAASWENVDRLALIEAIRDTSLYRT